MDKTRHEISPRRYFDTVHERQMISPFTPQPRRPDDQVRAEAMFAQARQQLDAHRLGDAEPLLRAALALAPNDSPILTALAEWHHHLGAGRSEQLELGYRAIRADWNNAQAHKAFALAARAHGMADLAIGHLRRCLELAPGDSNARFSLGLTLIKFGAWEEGWKVYDQRPAVPHANGYNKAQPPGTTAWQGEDLTGKTIALLGEDGHGDQIMTNRFVRDVLAYNPARIVLDCRPALRRLFLTGILHLPQAGRFSAGPYAEAGQVDYVISTGSLAGRFGANADRLATYTPYLRAPAPAPRTPGRLRIGLVWRGSPWLGSNRVRSIPVETFTGLMFRNPDIDWVSLQENNHTYDEMAALAPFNTILALGQDWDFAQTANIVASCDLVISVDTSIAHLAGALGVPVWLLNRATSEWRWGWKQSTSPWYPSMRIFNQETPLVWEPVVSEVLNALVGAVAAQ
jgi:tetratricopeptide (TPR) repeat protein